MFGLSVPASGLFSYENIHRRYLDCRRNKRNTINALRFEINAEQKLMQLQRELITRSYRPSRSIVFAANRPKVREVFAADFKDRVVHHLLVNYLELIWEPVFINDSYACRKGKGTHAAVARTKEFLRKITRNGSRRAYYLQLDIKDFFPSIDKVILLNILCKRVVDPDIWWLVDLVIGWDCTRSYVARGNRSLLTAIPANKSLFGKNNKKGLPIGNLISQFAANVYLNELDQFVKHELKAKYYIRYVDDFIIFEEDQGKLAAYIPRIESFLSARLKLSLHPKRRKIAPVSSGVDFLGYIVRPKYTLVRRRVVNNLKSKIISGQARKETIASYMGHFKWANTYRLKKHLSV